MDLNNNDKDNAFNLFVGLGYNNRNFFGGARNFTVRSRVSIQSIFDISIQNIVNRSGIRDSTLIGSFETTAELVQPYLFTNTIRKPKPSIHSARSVNSLRESLG